MATKRERDGEKGGEKKINFPGLWREKAGMLRMETGTRERGRTSGKESQRVVREKEGELKRMRWKVRLLLDFVGQNLEELLIGEAAVDELLQCQLLVVVHVHLLKDHLGPLSW